MVWFGNRVVSTTTTVDDFEDGNMNEYTSIFGSLGNYSAQQTGQIHSGTHTCEHTGTGNDEIHSYSGLNAYPSPGDTYVVHFYLDGADTANSSWIQIEYATNDSDNYYYCRVDIEDEDFEFYSRVGGSESRVAGTNHTWSSGQWHRVEIEFGTDGNAHTHTLYNDDTNTQLEQVSGTPTDGSLTGGIGFYSVSQNDTWWVDNCYIE